MYIYMELRKKLKSESSKWVLLPQLNWSEMYKNLVKNRSTCDRGLRGAPRGDPERVSPDIGHQKDFGWALTMVDTGGFR